MLVLASSKRLTFPSQRSAAQMCQSGTYCTRSPFWMNGVYGRSTRWLAQNPYWASIGSAKGRANLLKQKFKSFNNYSIYPDPNAPELVCESLNFALTFDHRRFHHFLLHLQLFFCHCCPDCEGRALFLQLFNCFFEVKHLAESNDWQLTFDLKYFTKLLLYGSLLGLSARSSLSSLVLSFIFSEIKRSLSSRKSSMLSPVRLRSGDILSLPISARICLWISAVSSAFASRYLSLLIFSLYVTESCRLIVSKFSF